MKKIILATMLLSTKVFAWNTDVSDLKVTILGSHGDQGFVSFDQPLHTNCQYGHLYFDLTQPSGKIYYSTLLAAKSTNSNIRIGYSAPTSATTCNLSLAAIQ